MSRHGCETCAVRSRALCGALDIEELTRLNALARHRHVSVGQTILHEQEPPPFLANIVSGVVKLTRTMQDGRHQIVGLQFPSDFLGRPYGDTCIYGAVAATDVQLCTFPTRPLQTLFDALPNIKHRLLTETLAELDAARDWMLLLGRKTAKEKVATLLLMIARRSVAMGCAPLEQSRFSSFALPLSRSEIADYLG